jgi:RNA polymerase sigma-70 factor (ECF subfamily)
MARMSASIAFQTGLRVVARGRSADGPAAEPIPLRDDDAALVERIAQGDQGAVAALYQRYSRQAYGLAVRVTVDPGLAEDAVQEAFCAVWRQAGRYHRSRGAASSWLMSLVHNKAVDVVRRESTRRRPLAADQLDEPVVPTPEQEALANEEGAAARRALGRLPVEQRALLTMLYLDGLTQREVADRLAVPLGTVKSRTHAAMRALRRSLAVG